MAERIDSIGGRLIALAIEIKIRQAVMSDASVITDCNVRLAEETEGLRLDPGCVAAGVDAVLADPAKGIYYIAELAGVMAGQLMITYEWSDWRNGNLWWLQSVYVKEEFRGRKVFRAMFEHLEELASLRQDVCGLRLYMRADNTRARQAYERLGMKRTHYEVLELDLPTSSAAKPK